MRALDLWFKEHAQAGHARVGLLPEGGVRVQGLRGWGAVPAECRLAGNATIRTTRQPQHLPDWCHVHRGDHEPNREAAGDGGPKAASPQTRRA
jgi:hypothetical protein